MTTGWGADGPAAAYEIIAATAAEDAAAVTAVLKGRAPGELWGVVIALGAQARQAAVILGGIDATRVRLRQRRYAAARLRAYPGARALAVTALSPLPVTPPAACPPDADLAAAARCLAAITAATMAEAGWSPRSVAALCDRARRLR
jgi:hypothetical protein